MKGAVKRRDHQGQQGDRDRDLDQGEAGYTLIEITIAITLLALMVATLYGSFHLSEKAMVKAQARAVESQGLRTFDSVLRESVHSAYPYRPSLRDAGIYFIGDDRGVEFVSSLSTGLGGRGMTKVRISSELAGNRGATLTLDEEMPVRVGDKDSDSGGGYRNSVVLAE